MEKSIEILIIEDDRRIAKIHEQFIASIENFKTVGIAYSVQEGKLWIENLQPQLVLLDIYLPDDFGFKLFDFIKEKSPDTDVILITSATEVDIVRKAYVNGVVDYLLKPLTLERFKQCLLSYKSKRMLFENAKILSEEEIRKLWNQNSNDVTLSNKMSNNPKGIDPVTKTKVIDFVGDCRMGITAEELGKSLGISRTTARRYLEHLLEERLIHVEHIYGSVGRPERRYFKI